MKNRLEADSVGMLEVPMDAYYGIHSLRGRINFPITHKQITREMIVSFAQIKKAAALANYKSGALDFKISNAISKACDDIIAGYYHDQFIVDPIQGGAGTSTNMNANEVIANRAIEILGGNLGDYDIVHPNDHVNMAQSTNDVYPTSGKLTVLKLIPLLLNELERLAEALKLKSIEFNDVIKMGRTQLQDAVPIRLGQSFNAYHLALLRDIKRLKTASMDMRILNIGGTAVGTAINVKASYLENITPMLQEITGEELYQAEDLIDATQNLDAFVYISGIIKTCAVNLSKIANDLRLLSSGPKTGVAEINLPAMQNGSSIMPGKVNPVIPEVISQIAFNIIGNDMTITMAAEAGQMELNAFEPILFYNLFESITTLTGGVQTFTDHCIQGITANKERCEELLNQSVGTITALCPYIGYKQAARIAKESLLTGRKVKDIILEENLLSIDELDTLLNPQKMTEPAIMR